MTRPDPAKARAGRAGGKAAAAAAAMTERAAAKAAREKRKPGAVSFLEAKTTGPHAPPDAGSAFAAIFSSSQVNPLMDFDMDNFSLDAGNR